MHTKLLTTEEADKLRRSMNMELLTSEEAAKLLRMVEPTLRDWRHQGRGPRYLKLNGGRVFYRREDIEAWLDKQYADAAGDETPQAS